MRNKSLSLLFVSGLVGPVIVLGLLAGCASDDSSAKTTSAKPAAQPASAVEQYKSGPASLSTIKSELVDSKAQLQSTMDALHALQKSSTGDAPANYDKFMEAYRELKTKSDAVSERSIDLRERAANYHAMWDREVGVVDPDLRQQRLQQKADAERIYGTIKKEMELTRNSFPPLMANLKEIGNYLRGNLVPAKLNSLSGAIEKADAQAKDVEAHGAAILAAIDEITAATGETVTPTKVDSDR